MPTFLFHAIDRRDSAELRALLRPDHRVHLRQAKPGCRCILAGPLVEQPGGAMCGTALVFEADDVQAVKDFMTTDPYVIAGLFSAIGITHWSIGLGAIA